MLIIKQGKTYVNAMGREKTEKIYKNNLTYLISMLLYNHVENTYITDMNNGGTSYEQDFRQKTVGIGCNG